MKKVGLWICEKNTVLVLLINTKINIHHIIDNTIKPNTSTPSLSLKYFPKIKIFQNTPIQFYPQQEYFEHIINYLAGAKNILIVGPDATPEIIYGYLRKTNKSLCNNVCNVKYMDYKSDPIIANYFINFFNITNEKK